MRECGAFLNERTATAWRAAHLPKAAAPEPAPHADSRRLGYTGGTGDAPMGVGWKHTLEWLAGQVLAA